MEIIDNNDAAFLDTQNSTMSVMDWFWTIIVSGIPLVGLVMLFVWAFGENTRPAKATWAKAVLLVSAVVIALYIVIAFTMVGCVGIMSLSDIFSPN